MTPRSLLGWGLGLVGWHAALGAEFEIQFNDGADFGFNDTTAVSPVGGNTGTTLGQQRRLLMERAAAIWGGYLQSEVPIVIAARHLQLGGSNFSATLAFAGPEGFFEGFPNAPQEDVLYASPLADSLRGADNDPGQADLSVTINESVDSSPFVLGGAGYYYGLDNEAPAGQVDLLSTLLHEIGHGLGFLSGVDETDGTLLGGLPDSFTLRIYDEETDKAWPAMTNAERQASAINAPDLTFRGPATQQASLRQLKPEFGDVVVRQLDSTGAVVQTFAAQAGDFGWGLAPWGLTGALVLVDDGSGVTSDACSAPFANAEALLGRIALIDRGSCNFDDKVKRAQDAGALGVLIVNNAGNDLVSMQGNNEEILIPSLFLGQADGDTLKSLLPGALVRLEQTGPRAGSTAEQVRLYAPNPTQSGSSVSHWSLDAYPDLLMEPSIASSRLPDLDLTLPALRDIGWPVENLALPYYTYALWAEDQLSSSQNGPTENADGDRFTNFQEYVWGSDPLSAASVPSAVQLDALGSATYRLTYQRNALAGDIYYQLVESSDLTLPENPALDGLDFFQSATTALAEDQVRIQLEITSSAPEKAFFLIEAEPFLSE
ncbi:MAG: PA domain-containing protein [Verrucomicrobiota bacterium]